MIKNDKQLAITKKKRDDFLDSLQSLDSGGDALLHELMSNAIKGQIETLEKEIGEYECLKEKRPSIICSKIEELPEILIKVRIVQGLSQNDLALKVGLQEQQIQRYEANNYSSATLDRILTIAQSMNIQFDGLKAFVKQKPIHLESYNEEVIIEATRKMQSKRTLFSVW